PWSCTYRPAARAFSPRPPHAPVQLAHWPSATINGFAHPPPRRPNCAGCPPPNTSPLARRRAGGAPSGAGRRGRGAGRRRRVSAREKGLCLSYPQQGSLRIIAAITQGEVIRKILRHLKLATDPPCMV